jgi:hypothetical protein
MLHRRIWNRQLIGIKKQRMSEWKLNKKRNPNQKLQKQNNLLIALVFCLKVAKP